MFVRIIMLGIVMLILYTSFDGRGQGYSVKAAQERGECKISPARLKNQGFVLLHSLIEGCHEVRVSTEAGVCLRET